MLYFVERLRVNPPFVDSLIVFFSTAGSVVDVCCYCYSKSKFVEQRKMFSAVVCRPRLLNAPA